MSEGVQSLGHDLDTALRSLGDVENLLRNLQKRTESVCLRITNLLSPDSAETQEDTTPRGEQRSAESQEEEADTTPRDEGQEATQIVDPLEVFGD